MIICPWCGTNYLVFQSNCKNCGGPIPVVDEAGGSSFPAETVLTPPPAPRPISGKYVWRLLSTDGWSIAAFVLGLLGLIFSLVGAGLTIGILTAFVGLPFLILGLAFLGAGGGVFIWRYQDTQKVVDVLRVGEAARGQVVEVQENLSIIVNGRHPWIIRYQFEVGGQSQEGRVTTLNQPGQQLQVGKVVCILFLPTVPKWSSIYPHP
jgi:hypothetical protein